MFLTWPVWSFFDWLRQRQDARRLIPAHALGRRGENLAHRYLQRRGYRVVERNWRSRHGLREADIIAWHGERLVLVEVKTRRTDEHAAPERNMDAAKAVALGAAAREYCQRWKVPVEMVRIDFIGVVIEPRLRIVHDVDALPLSG